MHWKRNLQLIDKKWLLDCLTLKDSDIFEISQEVPRYSVLELCLNDNKITDKSIPFFSYLIRESKTLKVIELQRNEFSAEGRKQLASICKVAMRDVVIIHSPLDDDILVQNPNLVEAAPPLTGTRDNPQIDLIEPSHSTGEIQTCLNSLTQSLDLLVPAVRGAAANKSESTNLCQMHTSPHIIGKPADDDLIVIIDDDDAESSYHTKPVSSSNFTRIDATNAPDDASIILDYADEPHCHTQISCPCTKLAPKAPRGNKTYSMPSRTFGEPEGDFIVIIDDDDEAETSFLAKPGSSPISPNVDETNTPDNEDVSITLNDADEPCFHSQISPKPPPRPLRGKNGNSCLIPAEVPVVGPNAVVSCRSLPSQTWKGAMGVKGRPVGSAIGTGSSEEKRIRIFKKLPSAGGAAEPLAGVVGEWIISESRLFRRSGRVAASSALRHERMLVEVAAAAQRPPDVRSKQVVMSFRRPRAWPYPRLPWLLPPSALSDPAPRQQPPEHVLPARWVMCFGSCVHLAALDGSELHLPGGRGRACAACVQRWRRLPRNTGKKRRSPSPNYQPPPLKNLVDCPGKIATPACTCSDQPRAAAGPVVDLGSVERRRHMELDVLTADVWNHFMEDSWRPERAAGIFGAETRPAAGGDDREQQDMDGGETEEIWFSRGLVAGAGLGREDGAGMVSDMELERLGEGLVRAAYGLVSGLLEVREITDSAHPCAAGRPAGRPALGVFAAGPLPPYTVLGPYTGEVREGRALGEGRGEDDYYEIEMEWLAAGPWAAAAGRRGRQLVIDAARVGSIMGYVNDFRSVAACANAQYCGYWVNGWPGVVVIVTRTVEAGEEVLVDYGEVWWRRFRLARAGTAL